MPDRIDALKILSDEGCLLVLKCLFRAKRKREGWVDYGYIKDSTLARREDIKRVYDVLSEKPDIVRVHRSLDESPGKVPKATTEDYFVETQRLHSETQLNRAIKRLLEWDLVERRERKHKRKQKHRYEYRVGKEGAGLYLKMDHADRILRFPETNTCIWSEEITSYSSTLTGLRDAASPSIPDNYKDAKRMLEEAIKNFRDLWRWRYDMSEEREKDHSGGEEVPRVIIVLDFSPMTQAK